MKLWDRAKNFLSGFVTACGAVGILYSVALQTGWIIDKATAQEIANDVGAKEEAARLYFVKEYKKTKLRQLKRIENPTVDDMQDMEDLKDEIQLINQRLKELGVEP